MLEIRQSMGLRVPFINAVLSLAQYSPSNEKQVASGKHTAKSRLLIQEHAEKLMTEGRIDPNIPTVVVSVRNTLSNLRCGAWVRSLTNGFITVAEEDPAKSTRPYHIIGMRKDGQLEITELFQKSLPQYEWAFSGVPILWEDYLYERMITECADHSHIWHIPRGNHPQATEQTKKTWEQLHEIFRSVLYVDRKTAAKEINKCASGLEREKGYFLHNAMGVDDDGRLLQLSSMGSLEKLGTELQEMGARRALMVDNGGSISVWFFPSGLKAAGIPLFALPNHRPLGTAYLFLQLEDAKFKYLWRES